MNSTRHGAAEEEDDDDEDEVDEPDLSMELAGSLQRCLEALELEFSKEVRKLEAPCDDLEDEIQCVQLKFADAAASEIVALLRSFNPELEEDDLSHDVHSIIHTQSVVGRLSTPMLAALRSFVPLKRGDWLARDIERHLFRQRRRQQSVWRKALAMLRRRGRSVAKDGQLRATALGVAAGAALGGSGAGALGLVAGGSFGAVCGLLPALVTFGVSVPTGAILGGTTGLVTGAAAGDIEKLARRIPQAFPDADEPLVPSVAASWPVSAGSGDHSSSAVPTLLGPRSTAWQGASRDSDTVGPRPPVGRAAQTEQRIPRTFEFREE
eukprot:s4671_g2.t4